MAYELVIIFVSLGWLLSIIPITYMYFRMRSMKKEVTEIKSRVYISQEEMDKLQHSLEDFRKNSF